MTTQTVQPQYVLGVDVGTSSARVALINATDGRIMKSAVQAIRMWTHEEMFEQSSEDIWNAACGAIRMVVEAAKEEGVDIHAIKGMGFCATCSLVALDEQGNPITVSLSNDNQRNVIVWMDHRAKVEADSINETKHPCLKYVGGKISLEMEWPKILWLKNNLPTTFKSTGKFMDLVDFLTFRATQVDCRSICTLACKWNFLAHKMEEESEDIKRGWSLSFLRGIGLQDIVDNNFNQLGSLDNVRQVGEVIGTLSELSANQMGISHLKGIPVAVGLIDAHASVGVLGATLPSTTADISENDSDNVSFSGRLALISGTSSCHMLLTNEPTFVPGVWGPYFSAMLPGMWLLEGGQSATGSLLDHILATHTAGKVLQKEADERGVNVVIVITEILKEIAEQQNLEDIAFLTKDMHMLPYIHGNRSPRADPSLTGVQTGLKFRDERVQLSLQYLCAIQAIAYGTKHIIETMKENRADVSNIFACGGLSKNELFLQAHADATQCPVWCPRESDAILLGCGVIAASAAKIYPSMASCMKQMAVMSRRIEPHSLNTKLGQYHSRKYAVFLKMYDHLMELRRIMLE